MPPDDLRWRPDADVILGAEPAAGSEDRLTRPAAPLRFVAPPETAVLTPAQLARWLQISERQVERLEGVPWERFGSRTRRVLVRKMIDWMQRTNGGGSMTTKQIADPVVALEQLATAAHELASGIRAAEPNPQEIARRIRATRDAYAVVVCALGDWSRANSVTTGRSL